MLESSGSLKASTSANLLRLTIHCIGSDVSYIAFFDHTYVHPYIVDMVHIDPSVNCKNLDPCSPFLHVFHGLTVLSLYTTGQGSLGAVVTATKEAPSHRYLNEIVHVDTSMRV